MHTLQIRTMIEAAITHEQQSGALANILTQVAQMYGKQPSGQELRETVNFIQGYIQHAPEFLDAALVAVKKTNIEQDVMPIFEAVEQYFQQPFDVIPDHLGLVGLMDDAYYAHCLLQEVSDRYRQQTGNALIEVDMTAANKLIRALIGEPHASIIDALVMNVLQGPALQQSLQQLMAFGMQRSFNVPDPMYGNASIDEIVNARMGALGIV